MTQNRKAPAYQEYAAEMMAKVEYREMSLSARGLLYTLRLECWVNERLPADPNRLAKVLGLDTEEVREVLPEVMAFFVEQDGFLRCPEMDDYRAHIEFRREQQREGGRKGAATANRIRSSTQSGEPSGDPQVTLRVARRSTPGSLVQNSQDKNSQIQRRGGGVDDDWSKAPNAYRKASQGE